MAPDVPDEVLTMARIAGGAAHDLRNVVLVPLVLMIERVERALADGDVDHARALLGNLAELARHGEIAVERLDQLARQHAGSEARRSRICLGDLAARAAEIAHAHASRHGTDDATRIVVAPTAIPAEVDAYEVTSAIVNLIVNAIDALGAAGGTVTVRVGGDAVTSWIEVADDGPGIPDDVRDRMFEPFFSTKGEHRSGLGLGMVAACMRRHGGTVSVDSAAGAGARFRLVFPS